MSNVQDLVKERAGLVEQHEKEPDGWRRDMLYTRIQEINEELAKASAPLLEYEHRQVVRERDALLAEVREWRTKYATVLGERDEARKLHESAVSAIALAEDGRDECASDLLGVRRILRAVIDESAASAASRVSKIAEARLAELGSICEALGLPTDSAFAAIIEQVGLLRDDGHNYGKLRANLACILEIKTGLDDEEIADIIAARIEHQPSTLEKDIAALKAALHVATRGGS